VDTSRRLTIEQCLPIIEYEVRHTMVPGLALDEEDLRQEAALRLLRLNCTARFDSAKGSGAAYVQKTVHNLMNGLITKACCSKRTPMDRWGHQIPMASIDQMLVNHEDGAKLHASMCLHPVVEQAVLVREVVGQLREVLGHEEWGALMHSLVEGAHIARKARGKQRRREQVALRLSQAQAAAIISALERRAQTVRKLSSDHLVRERAEKEDSMESQVTLPETPKEELPECYPEGEKPSGYDKKDSLCWQCPDKFTCLPKSLKAKLVKGAVEQDEEVSLVLSGKLPFDTAIQRMKRREMILRDSSGDTSKIPSDLMPTGFLKGAKPDPDDEVRETKRAAKGTKKSKKTNGASAQISLIPEEPVPEPEVEEEEDEEEPEEAEEEEDGDVSDDESEPEEEEEEPVAKPKKGKKAAVKEPIKKAKAPKGKVEKPAKKEAPPAPPKKAKAAPPPKVEAKPVKKPKPVLKGTQGALTPNGRSLPQPKVVPEEKMQPAIDRIKIGQPFDLDFGMQIVRVKRDGEVIVKITKQGFELDGKTYSSLSACAMWAAHSMASGNDYFNLLTKNAEIRDAKGKVLASRETLSKPKKK
jgi:hypothetical protein